MILECRITFQKSTTQFGHAVFYTTYCWDLTVLIIHDWHDAKFYDEKTGLDKLWTEEDYLSCWYNDPDADIHPMYDGYTRAHDELVTARVKARLRNFQSRVLGKKRPDLASTVQRSSNTLVPALSEESAQINFNDDDNDPLEWHHGYTGKRDALINHFSISWNAKQVFWLPFPGTTKLSSWPGCRCWWCCCCLLPLLIMIYNKKVVQL